MHKDNVNLRKPQDLLVVWVTQDRLKTNSSVKDIDNPPEPLLRACKEGRPLGHASAADEEK